MRNAYVGINLCLPRDILAVAKQDHGRFWRIAPLQVMTDTVVIALDKYPGTTSVKPSPASPEAVRPHSHDNLLDRQRESNL